MPALAAELHALAAERLADVHAVADFLEVSLLELLAQHGIRVPPAPLPVLEVGGPELAKSWDFSDVKRPRVGSWIVPWFMDERGPQVEPGGHPNIHILWLPVLVDQPVDRPDLEPLVGIQMGTSGARFGGES